jgi:hypothetical protein
MRDYFHGELNKFIKAMEINAIVEKKRWWFIHGKNAKT